jgi:hypothetical protein
MKDWDDRGMSSQLCRTATLAWSWNDRHNSFDGNANLPITITV